MKKESELKKWAKLIIIIIIMGILGFIITTNQNKLQTEEEKIEILATENVFSPEELLEKSEEFKENKALNEEKIEENDVKTEEKETKPVQNQVETNKNIEKSVNPTNSYRLTSYYPYESSNCTGSGKCTQHFSVNDKGWYLYDGKLVLAAATTYLQKSYGTISGRHYFRYYEEVDITIDGVTYRGIILDSCGACMSVTYEERIDLFVNSQNSVIDRGYKGNNPVYVSW